MPLRSRPGIRTMPRSREYSRLGPTTGTRPTITASRPASISPGGTVLTVTRDMILPTTTTVPYPRPLWFDRSLDGRSFRSSLGDSLFREQYLDAVVSIIADQESAGVDSLADGGSTGRSIVGAHTLSC